LLLALLAFVYAQALKPTFDFVKENPRLLSTVFNLTIPCSGLMLMTYLFELTVYDQHQRQSICMTQLGKVFFTLASTYLLAVVYAHWIQQIADYTKDMYWDNKAHQEKLREVEQEADSMA